MSESFIEMICKARAAATAHHIEANAIVISDDLYYSHFNGVDMICGLKCLHTIELPENTMFAMVNAENLTDSMKDEMSRLKHENKLLREFADKMETIHSELKGILNG